MLGFMRDRKMKKRLKQRAKELDERIERSTKISMAIEKIIGGSNEMRGKITEEEFLSKLAAVKDSNPLIKLAFDPNLFELHAFFLQRYDQAWYETYLRRKAEEKAQIEEDLERMHREELKAYYENERRKKEEKKRDAINEYPHGH